MRLAKILTLACLLVLAAASLALAGATYDRVMKIGRAHV